MAVEFKDYYKILGVSRDAADEDIRKSFRKLARKYHPDVAENKVEGEAKFKELNEAYEVLGDPEKRRKYDALGANWKHGADFRPPPGAGGFGTGEGFGYGFEPGGGGAYEYSFDGTGFSDFFEQLFGMRAGRAGRGGFGGFGGLGGRPGRGAGVAAKGSDIETDIMVTLDEVCRGSTRTLRLQRPSGPGGGMTTQTGKVKIPVGVQEGQRIRLAGLGEAGMGGGAPGDLYLRVRIERHPDFSARGSDLYHDLELAPWEAVLGEKVAIRTLKGTVSLTVPPGTGHGAELRMKGMGLPKGDGSFGDLHAVVCIVVPPEISKKERALWESLREESTFKPRR